jgi:hypothetical protein
MSETSTKGDQIAGEVEFRSLPVGRICPRRLGGTASGSNSSDAAAVEVRVEPGISAKWAEHGAEADRGRFDRKQTAESGLL